jgi:hypothetical protein
MTKTASALHSFRQAYLLMAPFYRPAAPGDGMAMSASRLRNAGTGSGWNGKQANMPPSSLPRKIPASS